jgi:hypothetical protein
MTDEDILAQIPPPPEGSAFHLEKVKKVSFPHPYCITPQHVEVASDHHCGILNQDAIDDAERRGVRCGGGSPYELPCKLSYREHRHDLTLFVRVAVRLRSSLNEIPGLRDYILSIKEKAESLGIQAFAFPHNKE